MAVPDDDDIDDAATEDRADEIGTALAAGFEAEFAPNPNLAGRLIRRCFWLCIL